MNSMGLPMDVEDTTSTAVADLMGQVTRMRPDVTPQYPMVTQQKNTMGGPGSGVAVRFARLVMKGFLVFLSTFLVSLPSFQDWVLSNIPKAVSPSGCLSTTGSFFKGIASAGIFMFLSNTFVEVN
jgi:hypothetical protein